MVALLMPGAALAERVTITADQWAHPRSGEAIVRLGELGRLIEAFDSQAEAQILIHYTVGESGVLWAEELHSWLVSLGVPSKRITLSADLYRNDAIVVETRP